MALKVLMTRKLPRVEKYSFEEPWDESILKKPRSPYSMVLARMATVCRTHFAKITKKANITIALLRREGRLFLGPAMMTWKPFHPRFSWITLRIGITKEPKSPTRLVISEKIKVTWSILSNGPENILSQYTSRKMVRMLLTGKNIFPTT